MRIIYVEDNLANVALVERICQMSQDELVTFPDAETALELVDPDSADLIFMDLVLGSRSIDGLQLTSLLRQKGVETPIVAITAYDNLFSPDQYLAAGCNATLRKPVSVPNMLAVIDSYR